MGNVGLVAASKNFYKITQKLNNKPILNIGLFPIYMESKLGVLSVVGKLVKDVF